MKEPNKRWSRDLFVLLLSAASLAACTHDSARCLASPDDAGARADAGAPALPLCIVEDVPLPGKAVRFDYQDIDEERGRLIIAHMDDASVVIASVADGSTLKVIPGIPTARGVIAGPEAGRYFVTSAPNHLVIIDRDTLDVIATATTGTSPDGVGWDPAHRIVGVSDQGDGAVSLISDAGTGTRRQVALGVETGNVVFDGARGVFWATVVASAGPDTLVAIDPMAAAVTHKIDLPGCDGAHGLRITSDGASAFVACENNSRLARVDLMSSSAVVTAETGDGPDVLAIDPVLGWMYVAAESGDLKVFDIRAPGLSLLDAEHPGARSHSVAVDAKTHHVFFPLESGPGGVPVLRIMRPSGG